MGTPNSEIFVEKETIRLTRDGVFLSDRDGAGPEEILHARTVDAFHRFLGKDEEGYFVRIGREFKRIEVEDTPRFVTAIRFEGTGDGERCFLKLYGGFETELDPTTLNYDGGSRLICQVPAYGNLPAAEARFLRAPYLELLLRAEENQVGYALRIGGKEILLAVTRM